MFFTLQVLSRKGALGTIWIAAHLEKKLKRQQITQTDIKESVDMIMNPEAPFALRLSSQLLFGVARIYRRQVGYLLQDCNDALTKMHNAFERTTLPERDLAAAMKNLTLPEESFQLMDLDLDQIYGQLGNIQLMDEDSFVKGIGPADLCTTSNFMFSGFGFGSGSGFEFDNRELPPMSEITPEDEAMLELLDKNEILPEDRMEIDVMRARSSLADPRLSFPAEVIAEKGDGDIEMLDGSLSKARISSMPMEPLDEMSNSMPKTPDNHFAQPPAILPALDFEQSPVNGSPEIVALPEVPEVPEIGPENTNDAVVDQKPPKKHRVIIDKRATAMTNAAFKKNHKQRMKDAQKRRNMKTAVITLNERDAMLRLCNVKQVNLSAECTTTWHHYLDLKPQEILDDQPGLEAIAEDFELHVPRSRPDDIVEINNDFAALVPSIRNSSHAFSQANGNQDVGGFEDIPFNEDPLLPEESFPQMLQKSPSDWMSPVDKDHCEPAGEIAIEPPQLDEPPHATGEEFSHRSRQVLSHLKRRLTERRTSFGIEEIAEIDCPSPKRRRMATPPPANAAISMFEMMKRKSRLEAARWFYELLVLKSHNKVKVEQSAPYEDILIHDVIQ